MSTVDHFLYMPSMEIQASGEIPNTAKDAYDRYAEALWNQEVLQEVPHKGYRVVSVELVAYEHGREFIDFSLVNGKRHKTVRIELPR